MNLKILGTNVGAHAGRVVKNRQGDSNINFDFYVGWWQFKFVWWKGEELPRCGVTHHARVWWLSKPKALRS